MVIDDKKLRELFRNKADCYKRVSESRGGISFKVRYPAMSEDKFIKLLNQFKKEVLRDFADWVDGKYKDDFIYIQVEKYLSQTN